MENKREDTNCLKNKLNKGTVALKPKKKMVQKLISYIAKKPNILKNSLNYNNFIN